MKVRRELILGTLVASCTTVICLVVAEIGLRRFAPVADPYEQIKAPPQPPNPYIRSAFAPGMALETEVTEGLSGVSGKNRFTTNRLGFRGPELTQPKDASEYRIFLVGGSSAETFYLDDEDALNAVLQRELGSRLPGGPDERVYNAGKSGDRSDDHVSMLVHRLVHLEPDLVVVFAGINDLRAAVFGYDYLHYKLQNVATRERLGLLTLAKLAAYELQLGRRLYYGLKRLQAPSRVEVLQTIPLRSNYRLAVQERRAASAAPAAPKADLEAYGRNLRTIAGAARANGIELVFMTQQTTWSRADPRAEEWQWMLLGPQGTYDAAAMHAAMEALNETMREVARAESVSLYDVAREIPPTLDYFYDDVHFNVAGARTAAVGLARVIAEAVSAQAVRVSAR